MHRFLFGAAVALLIAHNVQAQTKLETKGWGSLTGKVTLKGDVPAVIDLTPIMGKHNDAKCCLDPKAKPIEKVDPKWIVDPKTKGVANVIVWIKAPKDTYFPTHEKLTKRKDTVTIDQPHCAFLPHVAIHNPVHYDDNGKLVESGQKLLFKNSAAVPHNVRVIANAKFNPSSNESMQPKTEAAKKFNPQPLPIMLQCDIHPWMSARLLVLDHPYYAVTNEKGEFEIPIVPAGAKIAVMMWHEEIGYLVGRDGELRDLKEGKNTHDFSIEKVN